MLEKKITETHPFKLAFTKVDEQFLQVASDKKLVDGAYAATCFINKDSLYSACVGSSRSILYRDGKAIMLTAASVSEGKPLDSWANCASKLLERTSHIFVLSLME